MIDKSFVRSAIESASRSSAASAASCFGNIPSGMLNKAIELYASEAASEDVFALVPSQRSGKSGFVFTDRAMYFRRIIGSSRARLPYKDIIEVKKTGTLLRIATAKAYVEFDITPGNEILWERSRKNAAEFVATVLEAILQGSQSATASDVSGASTESPPGVEPTIAVEHSVPVDYKRAFTFHFPILFIGIPILMPAIYRWLAERELLKQQLSELLMEMSYGRLVALCAITLAPIMYAFGINLKFSASKFIVASLVIALYSLQAWSRAATHGQGNIVIPFGGGVLALVVALVLGYGSLAIRGLFTRSAKSSEAASGTIVEAQETIPADGKADCPSCRKTISLRSRSCPHCSADFGPGSAYRLTRRRE